MFLYFLNIFAINLAASAAKYCEKGAVNQSAASAGSPDSIKFQAVIKSAASAARGTPLELPFLDVGFLEAALPADLITA